MCASSNTSSPCVSLDGDVARNICKKRLSFTITWTGKKPEESVTYRINDEDDRKILKRNDQGVITAEKEFDDVTNNPEVSLTYTVETTPGGNVFKIANPTDHYVAMFFAVTIFKNGQESRRCSHEYLIPPRKRSRACSYVEGETYQVTKLRGEQDPD